ncbi:hypothetical protein FPOAC1_004994 [Fusarium poae]|uniref:hypothetical protein n=1 Tax=Fusarium poae TaxID=36050 RepID=UPI001CE96193|nr:hypothetical protein FPOAC1_004994 [Fusarium poae]KAG8671739.1 hypothetical protein FPOAC1_004994 [Fusarium poae]
MSRRTTAIAATGTTRVTKTTATITAATGPRNRSTVTTILRFFTAAIGTTQHLNTETRLHSQYPRLDVILL